MSTFTGAVPEAISISMQALAGVAVEYWRLSNCLKAGASGPARYALRKLEEFLRGQELEVRGFDGQVYNAGLAARVIDTIQDESLPAGSTVIAETVSPMVLWRGQVIREAELVTRQGTRG